MEGKHIATQAPTKTLIVKDFKEFLKVVKEDEIDRCFVRRQGSYNGHIIVDVKED